MLFRSGPYVAEATRMLCGIIRDMEPHQFKKRPLFARLAEPAPEPALTPPVPEPVPAPPSNAAPQASP